MSIIDLSWEHLKRDGPTFHRRLDGGGILFARVNQDAALRISVIAVGETGGPQNTFRFFERVFTSSSLKAFIEEDVGISLESDSNEEALFAACFANALRGPGSANCIRDESGASVCNLLLDYAVGDDRPISELMAMVSVADATVPLGCYEDILGALVGTTHDGSSCGKRPRLEPSP